MLLTVFDDVETYQRAGWPLAHTPVEIPPEGLEGLPGILAGERPAGAGPGPKFHVDLTTGEEQR